MQFLWRSLLGTMVTALTLAAFLWAGLIVYEAVQQALAEDEAAPPGSETAITVNAARIETGTVAPVLTVFGEIRSSRTLELRADMPGRIVEMSPNFEEGGMVTAGELLLRTDPAAPEAALALAEAELAEAVAGQREAARRLILAGEDLAASEEQAELRDQALARQRDLEARGVGSAAAVETAALAASSARQAVVAARQALAQAETGIDRAAALAERMRIERREAARQLDDTVLRAGFTGRLSGVTAVQGGLVNQNEQLGVLVDAQALEVSFRLSTAQYTRLLDISGRLIDSDVTAVLDVAGLELSATGRIARESASVGEGQAGRLIFARLDQSAGFRPGDLVEVQIAEPALDAVARLPALAVDPAGMLLAIDDENRLYEVEVAVLRRDGDSVLIRAPELEGALVVAERTPLLGAGILVRPLFDDAELEVAGVGGLVTLSPERRARLIAFVETSDGLSDEMRARVVSQLSQVQVPEGVVRRIESRMGS